MNKNSYPFIIGLFAILMVIGFTCLYLGYAKYHNNINTQLNVIVKSVEHNQTIQSNTTLFHYQIEKQNQNIFLTINRGGDNFTVDECVFLSNQIISNPKIQLKKILLSGPSGVLDVNSLIFNIKDKNEKYRAISQFCYPLISSHLLYAYTFNNTVIKHSGKL